MIFNAPPEVRDMRDRGALFVVNHSGGKDSQAMLIALRGWGVPKAQLLLIHADLGEVEWGGNVAHIRATAPDLPLVVARPETGFFDMVERRGMFPSPSVRQCTSDLKRGPIEREVRRHLRAHPEHDGLVVSCMGLRAEESAARSKKAPLTFSARNSKAGRTWYDWLPILTWTLPAVWLAIRSAGETPHPVYAAGMSRLSCRFCIMANRADLTTAARLSPALYAKYVATERRLGFTLSPSRRGLEEITGITAGPTWDDAAIAAEAEAVWSVAA
jgi:3'-phosphoadenosine 5'-phosphosulfate sulfotransferase (PAPS reductase)/FAD synthetase